MIKIKMTNTHKLFFVPFLLLLVTVFGIYEGFSLYYYVFIIWFCVHIFFPLSSRVSTATGLVLLIFCAISLVFKGDSLSDTLAGLSFIFLLFGAAIGAVSVFVSKDGKEDDTKG